jgi:hypothetical protein
MNSKFIYFIIAFATFIIGNHHQITGKTNQSKKISDILFWNNFSHYIHEFNDKDVELYTQYIPNSQSEYFLKENIPYFNCPDKELEKTYYFRWWTFRKHIKSTTEGFVITEFLPDVPWAGKYNTISCPAGHHFLEGRWLHNYRFLEDYANFWFNKGGSPRAYSFWAPSSILAFASVHQIKELVTNLLPSFDQNYKDWEKERLGKDGLFWQIDDRDGMEVSIGGSGKRATINSYMAGDAMAISEIAKLADNSILKEEYYAKFLKLRELILSRLWDSKDEFFKTMHFDSAEMVQFKGTRYNNPYFFETFKNIKTKPNELINVRELHGYTPWYFNIPKNEHSVAWKYLLTKEGFKAPYGPTTAEQKDPGFKVVYKGPACQWNGPSWPFSTSVTLKAMGNLLRNYTQTVVKKRDFIDLLNIYSNSHRRISERGDTICWIDENLNPFTGDWIRRTMKKATNTQPKERGKDYNHSEFCDIIISDLVGIQPSMENTVTINPLIPVNYWNWFCLDHIKYHDKILTIVWDRDGTRYLNGKGFSVFVDGVLKYNSKKIEKITICI